MSATSCAWMRQIAAKSGREASIPTTPPGADNVALTIAALSAAASVSFFTFSSGHKEGESFDVGISVKNCSRCIN